MEVPRLGIELELQLPAYDTASAMCDPSLVFDLCHSSWQHGIPNPLIEARDQTRVPWILVIFISAAPWWECPLVSYSWLPSTILASFPCGGKFQDHLLHLHTLKGSFSWVWTISGTRSVLYVKNELSPSLKPCTNPQSHALNAGSLTGWPNI